MTQHPELFTALAAPFAARRGQATHSSRPPDELCDGPHRHEPPRRGVGTRELVGRLHRPDHSVICRMTIRLPDGQLLTKVDAGGGAGLADEGDNEKSGFSDAFKRTAVKFGVSRYLYRDGVAPIGWASHPARRRNRIPTGSLPRNAKPALSPSLTVRPMA